MTARPPRRLRPSPERRVEVSVETHTALSAKGSVSVAAPVDPNRGRARPYVPPQPGSVITGAQADASSTSITSTVAGAGTSDAGIGSQIVVIGDNAHVDTGGDSDGGTGVAIGSDSHIFDGGCIAIGNRSSAQSQSGIAIGDNAVSDGDQGIAIGLYCEAHQHGAIGIGGSPGFQTIANGAGALAVGVNTRATADAATALGNGASARDTSSIALGDNAVAIGENAVAIGDGVTTAADNDFFLGTQYHNVVVHGNLIIADNLGGLHRLVVSTGGALSTVAYP